MTDKLSEVTHSKSTSSAEDTLQAYRLKSAELTTNIQFLLNLYRPHQARQEVIERLERQLQRRQGNDIRLVASREKPNKHYRHISHVTLYYLCLLYA